MKDKKKEKKKGGRSLMSILGGSFLVKEKFTKQFPFIVYFTVHIMIKITNTNIAEERSREIAKVSKELNDLHVDYIQLKSAIMQASKQSVLAKRLSGIGIKEPTEPLKRITFDNEPETPEEP